MTAPTHGDRVWLIDANNIVHRQFHALPVDEYRSPRESWPINAVVGWARSLRGLRRYQGACAIVPIFDDHDRRRLTWRHEIFPEYKANRQPRPDDLAAQWPLIDQFTTESGLPHVWSPGVEADDLIAAYTEALVARGFSVAIASNDKDLCQLVRGEDDGPGSVRVMRRVGGDLVMMGPVEVEAKFGVGPGLLGDLLALTGDKIDNIPGIDGIGIKTAARLLREHGDLESVLARWSVIPGALSAKVRDGAEAARLSRRLVGLWPDAPMPVPVDDLREWRPRRGDLDRFFGRLGFPRFEAALDRAME